MESWIAKDAERELVQLTQQLSPEARVNAFLEHCRLMMDLFEAGRHLRLSPSQQDQ